MPQLEQQQLNVEEESTPKADQQGRRQIRKSRKKAPAAPDVATSSSQSQLALQEPSMQPPQPDTQAGVAVAPKYSSLAVDIAAEDIISTARSTEAVEAGASVPAKEEAQTARPFTFLSSGGVDQGMSQPTSNVYVQQTAGFKKTEREQLEQALAEKRRLEALELQASRLEEQLAGGGLQAGILLQRTFRNFAITLQGIVAGFSLFHCLIVVVLAPPNFGALDFLDHYSLLAMPLHAAYYASFVLCLVAVLDRYDVSYQSRRCVKRMLTAKSAGGLCILVYLVAMILSLTSLPVEERMEYYHRNASRTATMLPGQLVLGEVWTEGDLGFWRAAIVARTIAAVIGWLTIALRPSTDLLSKHVRYANDEFARIPQDLTSTVQRITVPHLEASSSNVLGELAATDDRRRTFA